MIRSVKFKFITNQKLLTCYPHYHHYSTIAVFCKLVPVWVWNQTKKMGLGTDYVGGTG